MISTRFLLWLTLFCGLGAPSFSQDSFSERLIGIRDQLDVLAESTVPSLNEMANFSVSNMPLQSFLRSVAEVHELNIQVDPSLSISLSNNFTNVRVMDLLIFLCEEYQLDIRFTNSIMSFFKYQPPKKVEMPTPPRELKIRYDAATGLVAFDLMNDSLRSFLKQVTRITRQNVIGIGNELDNRIIRGYIQDLPLEGALEKLAVMNGLKFSKTRDGVYVFESQGPVGSAGGVSQPASRTQRLDQGGIQVKDSLIDIDVAVFPILEILNQVSLKLDKSYILFSEITGATTVKIRNVKYDELLSFLFQGTPYAYKKIGGVYLIGQRNLEGFRTTEVVKLDFRPVEGVDKEIPAEMLKEVELKVFKELNSFIITGNRQKLDELVAFLKLIDQPVPNILIEVIVADAKKGFSLQMGLQAFLSDSVPRTRGQVFPGVDVTLSSRSINDALEKLDSRGIINLGRVSPQFYMTLQAMEKNNNIQLRSTPKLSTINGNKANLVIGQSVYYLEQTQNITGGVNPITTTAQRFNKVEANLSITITPVVSGNEHITLDIVAEFSNFIPPTIPNAPPGNATRKFESKIRVKNEEMIILGGLEELSRSDTGSGTPLLSRIPVLKWLFSSRSKETSDNRLIVFIKPTMVY